MRYEIDMEEEMEKQAEVEAERELIGWMNKTQILEDIERSCQWEILEDVRSLRNDESESDGGIMNEDGYRISLESFSKEFYQN